MSREFTFLPAFARADADVNLLLLENNVAFTRQVNDTLFLAQNATTFYFPNPVTMFIPNVSMSALGCAEQYQLCRTDLCADPGGYYQFASQSITQQLNLNAAQNAGILAAQIIGSSDSEVLKRVAAFKEKLKEKVEKGNSDLKGRSS